MSGHFGMEYSSYFRRYISKYPKLDTYFKKSKSKTTSQSLMRFETEPGEQTQLEWKKSMNFTLCIGEIMEINIFALILSFHDFASSNCH